MKLLLAALSAFLGGATLDTEDAAIAALKAYKPQPAPLSTALTAALGLQTGADETAALTAVATLKGAGTSATAAIASLQGQIAELTAKVTGAELTTVVDKAIADGKLQPALRDWALGIGKTDMAALTGFIEKAPVIPGLAGQSGGKARDTGDAGAITALSATQELIAKQMGIAPDAYLKQLQAAAA